MADRRVRVTLEAQVDAYKRGMDQAARSTEQVGDAADKAGQSASGFQSSMSGIGGSLAAPLTGIRDNVREIGTEWSTASRTMRSEMTTVGAGFVAMGGIITGIGASLLSTGIQYNSLQQVAGKALETMTGSASEAAEQMDRLNEFASTSPFFRETWLEAQRQLMAFGMEAERVVPTLEGVEEAVAAIGGGDAEIRRLVDILGQIEGQGKITGRELQRLGQMGINAADLIGEAMGVSGNEIRERITAGTLDAETAITALTEGMKTRFEGSADAIRDTFEGAKNDMVAAWRDLGSIIAEPLVGADGGGLLVGLTNNVADFLRLIQRLPDPVIQVGAAIAGLGGMAMIAYGGMFLLAPQIVAFREAQKVLNKAMPRTNALVGGLSKAAGIAAGSLLALQLGAMAARLAMTDFEHSTMDAEKALQNGTVSALEFEGNIWGVGRGFDTMGEAIARATDLNPAESMAEWGADALDLENSLTHARTAVENFDTVLAEMISKGDMEGAAEGFRQIIDEANDAGVATTVAAGEFTMLEEALHNAGITMDEFLVAIGASKGVYDEANGTYQETNITLEELAERFRQSGEAAAETEGPLDGLEDALAEIGLAADGTVESLALFTDALFEAGLLTQSVMEAEASFEAQLRSVDEAVQSVTDALAEDYVAKGHSEEAARALAAEQVTLGSTLNSTGTAFDLTTAAGEEAQGAFLGVADRGRDLTTALAENNASQSEVQGSLRRTYDSLIETGMGFGMTKSDAEALTREVLGIPDRADIDSWMSEEAKRVAEETKRAIDAVDGRQSFSTHHHTIRTTRIGSSAGAGAGAAFAPGGVFNRATGGAIHGPGTGTSDDIPALLSNGEHVFTAREVQLMGGHRGVYEFRAGLQSGPSGRDMIPAYASGGAVGRGNGGGGGPGGINFGDTHIHGGDTQQVLNRFGDEIFRRLRQEGVPIGSF